MSEILQPGSYFKIGETGFEYQGTRASPINPAELEIVARTNPEKPVFEGAIHTTFPLERIQKEAVRIGPFNELFPYSTFAKERSVLQGLFGPELEVPHPPKLLVDTLENAREVGINSFEPHYVPEGQMLPAGISLNSRVIPYREDWKKLQQVGFFDLIRTTSTLRGSDSSRLYPDTLDLPGKWLLVDTTKRPNAGSGRQMYGDGNDPFKPIIDSSDLKFDSVIPGSRFGATYVKLNDFFMARLANILKSYTIEHFNSMEFTVPSAVVFNFLGNVHYPEWGEVNTNEWLSDVYHNYNHNHFLIGGSSEHGGLSFVQDRRENEGAANRGFRPMIIFKDPKQGGNK